MTRRPSDGYSGLPAADWRDPGVGAGRSPCSDCDLEGGAERLHLGPATQQGARIQPLPSAAQEQLRRGGRGGRGGTCWLPSLYPRGLARGSQVRDLCPKVGGPVVTVLAVPTGPGTAGSGHPRPPSALLLAGADAGGGGGWGSGRPCAQSVLVLARVDAGFPALRLGVLVALHPCGFQHLREEAWRPRQGPCCPHPRLPRHRRG